MNDPLLSIEDLSTYLKIPVNTLYQWRKTGKGPAGFRAGKYVRYRSSDVDAWITEQAAC
jgi:excisionase family DNA binding protein